MAESNADRRERVGELVRLGETDPGALADHVSDLEAFLAADSAHVRRRAARAVATLADADPDPVVPLVDRLAEGLSDEAVQCDAAVALGNVAETEPGAVMGELAALVAVLDGDGDVLVPASGALASIAAADAGTLAQPGVLDRLFGLLSNDRSPVRGNAAAALSEIAAADATAVCSGADDLRARLDDDAAPVRRDVAVALGAAAPACPDAVVAAVPDLAALGDDPDEGVRAGAAFALCHAVRAEEGRQRTVDALIDATTDDTVSVRQHATFALASLAADDPDVVRPGVDALARRLVDESAAVRRNARSALASLEVDYPAVVTEARADVRAEMESVDEETGSIPYSAADLRGLAGDADAPGAQRAAADHALALIESGAVSPTPDASGGSTARTGEQAGDGSDATGAGADAEVRDADAEEADGTRVCPKCGETLESGGEFCPVCGIAVD